MMDEKCGYKTPTPADSLEQQIIDPSFPKNEREWWAAEEITRLRAEVEALRADAATLAWLRSEHDRPDPLVKCVIKEHKNRSGGPWAEFIDGSNFAETVAFYAGIDAELAAQGGEHG